MDKQAYIRTFWSAKRTRQRQKSVLSMFFQFIYVHVSYNWESLCTTWRWQPGTDKIAYRPVSNISRTLVGNKIVDHSDVVGASLTPGTPLPAVQWNEFGPSAGLTVGLGSVRVRASPVGAAPTTSSFSTWRPASLDWEKTTAWQDEKHLNLAIWCDLYQRFYGTYLFRHIMSIFGLLPLCEGTPLVTVVPTKVQ